MSTLLPLPDLPGTEALAPPKQPLRRRRVVFLVFTDVEIVDLCGPLDVFHHANNTLQLTRRDNELGYETLVVALQAGPVKTAGGLEIIATHGCDDELGEIDTLVVPGSPWIELACAEPRLIDWLQATAPRVRRLVSVCTGAFLLARAGLLENRFVTTHWMYCERLAALHPSLRIERDRIFVRDGHVYTSGGITAGIDLTLSLIEEDLGREAPRFIAGLMVVFLRRPGGQNQFSIFLQAEAPKRPDIRELQSWILANPAGRPRRGAARGAHQHELAEFRATISRRERHDARKIRRACARGGGALQARTNECAARGNRSGSRFWLGGADAAFLSAAAECQSTRLSSAVSVNRTPRGEKAP